MQHEKEVDSKEGVELYDKEEWKEKELNLLI